MLKDIELLYTLEVITNSCDIWWSLITPLESLIISYREQKQLLNKHKSLTKAVTELLQTNLRKKEYRINNKNQGDYDWVELNCCFFLAGIEYCLFWWNFDMRSANIKVT